MKITITLPAEEFHKLNDALSRACDALADARGPARYEEQCEADAIIIDALNHQIIKAIRNG